MKFINKNLLNSTVVLFVVAAALMVLALWAIFIWVPTDANQGAVQRIFYLHVPVAWVCMLAIFFVALGSILYLITGKNRWDRFSQSVAEVGVIFGTLMLLSGIIWARPVWGQWWTGEAKLTTALILYLIYISYLVIRTFMPEGPTRNKLAAVIAIIGSALSPIIYLSAQLFEQAHPPIIVGPLAEDSSAFSGDFGITLLISTFALLALFLLLTNIRYKLRATEDTVGETKREIDMRLAEQ